MGAFFTNVQVLAGEEAKSVREHLLRAIVDRLRDEGFVEATPEEEADRTVLIGDEGRWITVYDEATEDQAEDDLHALAQGLSTALDTRTLTVLVHDSDVLRLALFEKGKKRGEFDSFPGYFDGKRKKQKAPVVAFAGLLSLGHHRDELKAAFATEKTFAEAMLARLAELFGMDPKLALLGFAYAEQESLELTRLRFRGAPRPPDEAKKESLGPPRFGAASYLLDCEVSVGEPLHLGYSVRNDGGPSKGVDVVVWGPAIDEGIVVVQHAEHVVLDSTSRGALRGLPAVTVSPFEKRAGKDGVPVWIASFPEAELRPYRQEGALGMSAKALVERDLGANVHANIKGTVQAPGDAVLGIGFVPHSHSEGQFGFQCQIFAHPASRRPLRAASATAARALDDETVLFGLASLDVTRDAAAAVVAPLIERWGVLLPERGSYSLSLFRRDPEVRPGSETAKASGFFGGARWKRLRKELATEAHVVADRRDESDDSMSFQERMSFLKKTDGFSFGTSIASEFDKETHCPTLALWMNVRERPDAVSPARQLLAELLDELMLRARGIQALIGCWNWLPMTLESTPYETSCGVHGQCTLTKPWLTRFVRGVTRDPMWLGPDLLGRLERQRLDEVAVVTEHGHGVRLQVRPESSLDELESALAPVLPGASDWKAGVDRYYGR